VAGWLACQTTSFIITCGAAARLKPKLQRRVDGATAVGVACRSGHDSIPDANADYRPSLKLQPTAKAAANSC